MRTVFCNHFSVFIEIIISVISCSLYGQICNIPYLGCCCEFSQIIYHIAAIKSYFCICGSSIFLCSFRAGKIFYSHYLGSTCLKLSGFIMIIKSIQNCPINFHVIKIMYCRCCIPGSIFFQTVKSVTFHKIFSRSVLNRSDLCFISYRKKAVCGSLYSCGCCHNSKTYCKNSTISVNIA